MNSNIMAVCFSALSTIASSVGFSVALHKQCRGASTDKVLVTGTMAVSGLAAVLSVMALLNSALSLAGLKASGMDLYY